MKLKIFIVCVAVACIAGIAAMGGANKSSPQSMNAAVGDTLTLNLYDKTYTNWTDTLSGGYWYQTYNDSITSIRFGDFVFSHLPAGPGASFGGYYWDGFITGSNGDNGRYGLDCPTPMGDPCDSTHSKPWVEHQWGIMAGGGLDSSCNTVKGVPYLIAYWGFFMEPEYYNLLHMEGTPPPDSMHCLTVHLADNSLFAPQEVWICNHPWPYWGNIYGDGFARPLTQAGDRFGLFIHGVKVNGQEVLHDSINLAVNIGEGIPPIQETIWEKFDLTDLGDSIQYLYFTMYTTDADPQWGPNTAVYFNMDRLKVVNQGTAPTSTLVRQTKAPVTTVPKKPVEVKDYFPLTSYTGGEVVVYDAKGKEALRTAVKAGEKVNLSKLPAGEYHLRHGHRVIPFKKVQ